jgi:MFS family permease
MLLPEMVRDLAISKTQAGTIFAVYFVIYTLCSPVLGALSDRYNYRVILTFFAVIAGAGALLLSQATDFLQACLAFSVVSVGHTACWAPVVALVQKWVPDHRKGLALSVVCSGVGVGIIFWGVLLPVIVSRASWRAGWAALGWSGLAVALLTLLLVRTPVDPEEPSLESKGRAAPFWNAYGALMHDPAFWIIGISYLLAGFNVLVPFTFLPVYAKEQLHVSYATATRFIVIIAASGIVGQLSLGSLSDRIGRVRLMMACGMIMGLGCLAMIFVRNVWLLYAVTAVYGVGYGAVWPIYAAIASDFFPKRQTGSVVGLWTALLGLGSIVSPVVCGWTIDQSGSYTWSFVLGLISGVLSALIPMALSSKSS